MKSVDYEGYMQYKLNFLKKHDEWTVSTSPMNEYGEWHKTYSCSDGAEMHENMRPIYRQAVCIVHDLRVKVQVKLLETELYSSDDAQSVYYYEVFNHEKEATI